MLRIELDDEVVAVNLPKPLDGSTWTATMRDGGEVPLAQVKALVVGAYRGAMVSVAQDGDGQHWFVRLDEAVAGKRLLTLVPEAAVKEQGAPMLLYARAPATSSLRRGEHMNNGPTTITATGAAAACPPQQHHHDFFWDYPELAPHGRMSNYAVVAWCSPAKTRALILCDEATLCRDLPDERILGHVTLVVNCHEDAPRLEKYRCGRAARGRTNTGPPLTVVAHAVHKWHSGPLDAIGKNDEIQRAIWDHLQNHGSVAVHCLAGIHRAAVITVCHFLYRHYILGHTEIPRKTEYIYKLLQSVRPAVSPAYLDILRAYEDHCKKKARQRGP